MQAPLHGAEKRASRGATQFSAPMGGIIIPRSLTMQTHTTQSMSVQVCTSRCQCPSVVSGAITITSRSSINYPVIYLLFMVLGVISTTV